MHSVLPSGLPCSVFKVLCKCAVWRPCIFTVPQPAKICQVQISKKNFRRSKKNKQNQGFRGEKKIFCRGGFKTGSGQDPEKKRPETAATPRTQAHTPAHTHAYAHAHGRLRLHTPARIHTHMPAHTGVPAHTCPHTPSPAHMGAHLHAHAYARMGAHTRTRTQERNASGTDHAKTQEQTRTDRGASKQSRAGTDRRIIDQERNGHGDRSAGRYRQGTPTPTRTDERPPRIHVRLRARWIVGTPDHHSHRRNTASKRSNICSKPNGCSIQGTSQPPSQCGAARPRYFRR